MSKRLRLNNEDIKNLAEGNDITIKMSPKRTLVLGTKSDKEIRKDALKAKFEAQLAELEKE